MFTQKKKENYHQQRDKLCMTAVMADKGKTIKQVTKRWWGHGHTVILPIDYSAVFHKISLAYYETSRTAGWNHSDTLSRQNISWQFSWCSGFWTVGGNQSTWTEPKGRTNRQVQSGNVANPADRFANVQPLVNLLQRWGKRCCGDAFVASFHRRWNNLLLKK